MVGEEGQEGEPIEPELTLADQMKMAWLDFDDFMACFKYIVIFHKTNTYPHVKTFTDMKGQVVTRDRRLTSTTFNGLQSEDKAVYFLTVDSLEPIELVFSVSAICKWPEVTGHVPSVRNRELDSMSDVTSVSAIPNTAGGESQNPPNANNCSGELLVERHSWKSLANGPTILRLHTYSVRATALMLPAGRHVLRLVVGAPLAYHLTVCSMAAFSLGEEDLVMQSLTKESLRYTDTALKIVNCFINCLNSFGKPNYSQHFSEMMKLAMPSDSEEVSKRKSLHGFIRSLASATKQSLGETVTPDMNFAWSKFFQFLSLSFFLILLKFNRGYFPRSKCSTDHGKFW